MDNEFDSVKESSTGCSKVTPKKKQNKKVEQTPLPYLSVTVQLESLCLVNSSLSNAKKNLKKLDKIYDSLNQLDYKKLKGMNGVITPLLHTIYYELWFMFMDEITHIQKDLIEYTINGQNHLQTADELMYKITLLMKPISISFFKFKPPPIKLFVPQIIYDGLL